MTDDKQNQKRGVKDQKDEIWNGQRPRMRLEYLKRRRQKRKRRVN